MKATLAYINRLISACRSRLAGCDCCVVNDSRNAVARSMVLTGGKGMKNSFRKIRAVDSFATTTTCTHFDDSTQKKFIHRKISEVIGFSSGYPRGVDFRLSTSRNLYCHFLELINKKLGKYLQNDQTREQRPHNGT